MAKKKIAGQINFFRAMAALGLVVIIAIVYGFFGAAPNLSQHPFHNKSDPMEKCLDCHMINVKSAPIMPHRVMDFCTTCHKPQEDE
ncbi:MAG: hypothetical protein IIA62_00055 [Nitrospinae bacterium]|nr:hypothetical protein [Nitrospinota bacterium]